MLLCSFVFIILNPPTVGGLVIGESFNNNNNTLYFYTDLQSITLFNSVYILSNKHCKPNNLKNKT